MSDDKKYNGWANYETWLCNLWYDDAWREDASQFDNLNDLADYIKSAVEEHIEEQLSGQQAGFIQDLVGAALSEIDWYEIAEHYEEDLKKADDDDESE